MTVETPIPIHADIDIRAGNAILVTTTQMPVTDSPVQMDVSDAEPYIDPDLENFAPLGKSRAFVGWLIVCFSTGPTSGVVNTYVSASIQTVANAVGHKPGSIAKCASRGTIFCVVKFGSREVDYLSYLIYLKAIARAMEAVVVIMVSGIADYSSYRKSLMIGSILLYGILALPFAGLVARSYTYLNALGVLYCLLSVISGVYAVMESSYVPMFMRSAGIVLHQRRVESSSIVTNSDVLCVDNKVEEIKEAFVKGTRVSVLGFVIGNVGAMTSLLIGIVIVHTRGSYVTAGYHNFLLSITIAGCLTIIFVCIGSYLLPSVHGKELPTDVTLATLPLKNAWQFMKAGKRYPEAFKVCVAWITWYNGSSNYLSLIAALFLEVSDLSTSGPMYTVWSFTSILSACLGSLTLMFLFPHTKFPVKRWAYGLLFAQILCVFWGTLGISSKISIGYKQVPEFWVQQVIFMSSSSALRSYNRMLFASLLPIGSEAQFFGLEFILDLATGWINTLLQGFIQNRTHNLRFPMLPNMLLMLVAMGLYLWVDVEKGLEDAKTPLNECEHVD